MGDVKRKKKNEDIQNLCDDCRRSKARLLLHSFGGSSGRLMIPPPLWFWIASLVVLIPAARLGARLAPVR